MSSFLKSKKSQRIVINILVLTILGVWIHHMSVFRPAKNFHVVDPGHFYRSAQLAKDEFEDVVHQYGIKTVINLRGSQPGEWWFEDETSELKRLGVKMENIGFSSEQMQTKEDWAQYAEILRTAERPILVHCRSGADRTSEASAVYEMDYMGKSHEEALQQLSIKFLHLRLFMPAKDLFVSNYHGRDWLLNTYDPCLPPFRPYAKHESYCEEREKAKGLTAH